MVNDYEALEQQQICILYRKIVLVDTGRKCITKIDKSLICKKSQNK